MSELKSLLLFYTFIVHVDANINYVCDTNMSDILHNKPINYKDYCQDLKKPCAPKCCGLNEVLIRKINNITGNIQFVCDVSNLTWVDETDDKQIKVYSETEEDALVTEKNFSLNHFSLVQNKLYVNENCGYHVFENDEELKLHLLEDGKLGLLQSFSIESGWKRIDPEYFCVDRAYTEGKTKLKVIFFLALESPHNVERERLFIGVASVISSIFLFVVLLIYCLLPTLRNLPGMLLMAHMASLLSTLIIRTIMIFFSAITCEIITAAYYFVYLSTFFWLHIMSIDIWWNIRGLKLKLTTNRREEVVKFLWYTLYGWGAPLAITVAAVIIDSNKDDLPPSITRPGFNVCLSDEISVYLYMHLPTGLLTLSSIVLFLMTSYNIWLIKKKLNVFKSSSSSTKKNNNRFGLYVKMSMLVFISCFLELGAMLYDDNIPFGVYALLHSYNGFIGLTIFILFILNRKTLRMLCERFKFRFPCRSIQDFIEDM